ncbi:hypothetical protein M409DRAFT_18997 [Zasmidium cellare ATCC 36951]|uniref:SnoaL-like domain-containing protein n=1 Tax=Zasmidium cellare ATCC 36951 TaxID=1080233 RepID=A0A6A6CV55_ZASCE|nr:uncharacterized protein M409DRAFT_18997 [Zasmidium cellare ATCC 36951]KAF2171024.1 hypothetical protein M409DRAFT_18997 [Zasmidium cellare ATCC 36951]
MPPTERVLAECEIRSLIIKERYYRDSNQWQKLRGCYHPDASRTWLNISWFTGDIDAFVKGSIGMADGGTTSSHNIQPAEVQINNDKAFVVSTGNINIRVEFDGVEYELISAMRLLSRLERVSAPGGCGEWFIVRVEIIYDRDYIIPTSPLTGKEPTLQLPKDARPSYKFLDYVLSRQGFSINKNLAGTDKAGREAAAKLMEESEQWLAAT